jgi:hypothetical protein
MSISCESHFIFSFENNLVGLNNDISLEQVADENIFASQAFSLHYLSED